MTEDIPYRRIEAVPVDFSDADAVAVEALGVVWRERLQDLQSSKALKIFNEELYRRWAIETGILERLYAIDRGITQILVQRGLDVSLIEHGSTDRHPEEIVPILKDHRDAVQYVMDFVAGDNELSLHFIRSLHQILTAHQSTVEGADQFGNAVRLSLVRGDWKQVPNNPTRPDGTLHAYCPPHLVQEEMEALLRLYLDLVARQVPTTILSAWLHHRFAQIHPFQDGNGRVARALAAFVFVKSRFFPIVIDRDERGKYIDSLEAADHGDLRPLVGLWNLLQRRAIESALSLSESVLTGEAAAGSSTMRSQLLAAIEERARHRRAALLDRQRVVLTLGDRIFDEVIKDAADELRTQLDKSLRAVDRDFYCGLECSTIESQHWFKIQLVELAAKYDYFCDLTTYHRWARLKIRHRSASDDQTFEIVLSCHGLGRSFAGVLAVSGYYADRDHDADGRSISGPPHRLAERPVSFTYAEAYDDVQARVRGWVDAALDVALSGLQRNL